MANAVETVAKLSKVSPVTVRRAMRGDPSVREATRRRIHRIAERVGYRPNAAARALNKPSMTNVGFVVAVSDGQTTAEIMIRQVSPFLVYLARELEHCRMNLLVSDAHEVLLPSTYETTLPRIVSEGHADMLVVYSFMTPQIAERLRKMKVPAIVLEAQSCGLPAVQVDQEESVGRVVDRLVALGHRRIGFMNHEDRGDIAGYRDVIWPEAYVHALQRHGLSPVAGWEGFVDTAEQSLDRMLNQDDPPTAVITYDDQQAHIVVQYLMRKGLRVPDDFSVAGLKSRGIGQYLTPKISHMIEPWEAIARAMARQLVGFRRRMPVDPQPEVFKMQWFEGETVGPAAR